MMGSILLIRFLEFAIHEAYVVNNRDKEWLCISNMGSIKDNA